MSALSSFEPESEGRLVGLHLVGDSDVARFPLDLFTDPFPSSSSSSSSPLSSLALTTLSQEGGTPLSLTSLLPTSPPPPTLHLTVLAAGANAALSSPPSAASSALAARSVAALAESLLSFPSCQGLLIVTPRMTPAVEGCAGEVLQLARLAVAMVKMAEGLEKATGKRVRVYDSFCAFASSPAAALVPASSLLQTAAFAASSGDLSRFPALDRTLFEEDGDHLSRKGYRVWEAAIEKFAAEAGGSEGERGEAPAPVNVGGGEKLNLSNSGLTAGGAAEALREVRKEGSKVTTVDLSFNSSIFSPPPPGSTSTISELCSLLAENETVTALDISGTDLGPKDATELARALKKNTAVRSLGVKNCKNAAPILAALLMR